MVGIGIAGYGYWGPNLVRNFAVTPGASVVAVCDMNANRLAQAKARHPNVEMLQDFALMLKHPKIDAIAIATPVSSHFDLAMQALKAGKHVFVEKPMVASLEQAHLLVAEAEKRKLQVMVDHTFIYTGAVRKINELISSGELGDLYYYDSVRVNLGLFQHDVSVVWDLAVHDLAILDYISAAKPCAVSATGISHVPGQPENLAYITLFYPDRLMAHIHVNWLAPVKVRQTLIGGSRKMIIYDDVEPSEKIKIYDKGISLNSDANRYKMLIGYRTGDMWAPCLDVVEALTAETAAFLGSIESGKPAVNDGHSGLRVVRVLEAATKSMADRGRPIELKPE
jgi:predicted dehydrogenase